MYMAPVACDYGCCASNENLNVVIVPDSCKKITRASDQHYIYYIAVHHAGSPASLMLYQSVRFFYYVFVTTCYKIVTALPG